MTEPVLKPTDLRGILEYVPKFRDHVFVIAVDGSVVDDANFDNVLTDLAVLASLNIRVVLVHGIGQQIRRRAAARGVVVSDVHGSGPTDDATLELAIEASQEVAHVLMAGLTRHGLRYVASNVVRAKKAGILDGIDQGHTGRVDSIAVQRIQGELDDGAIPLISPIAFDVDGRALRVDSDHLAAAVAVRVGASKVIYLTLEPGLVIDGESQINLPVEALIAVLETAPDRIAARTRSKAVEAVAALEQGVPRAHVLDGSIFGGLLTEIFDKVGLGTMIHANEYQQIRGARREDLDVIHAITRAATAKKSLKPRTREEIEAHLDDYAVYEVEGSVIACIALTPYPEQGVAELGSVLVQPFFQGRGVGRKLVEYACRTAAEKGFTKALALSTQSFDYFKSACGFVDGGVDDLPPARRAEYEASGRRSAILTKALVEADSDAARG